VADQRITQLNQLAEADVAAIDVLPIVDISASETKKVTAKDLFEAGATLADNSSIDLAKLNQSSTTKIGTTALADDAVTAAKLADDSSIVYDSTEPVADNFEGRGYVNSTSKNLQVWDGSAFQQVVAPTAGIEDGAVTTNKIADNAVTTVKVDAAGLGTAAIADDAITSTKILDGTIASSNFAPGAVDTTAIADDAVITAKIADGNVTTDSLADDAVTGAKLADDSATVVDTTNPSGSGDFVGQQWINANTGLTQIWDGTEWIDSKAVQTITFTDSTPITFAVAYPTSTSAEVTTTLDTQAAASVFAGPISGVDAEPSFRALEPTDLPIAEVGTVGVVQPGTGLNIDGAGTLNHLNSVTAGTYTKVTVDAQGHVTTGDVIASEDIPDLDASKITSGTFGSAFLAENSVTAEQLADNGIAQVSQTAPVPQFSGQWWVNPSDRSTYIWVGSVAATLEESNGYWLNLGYGNLQNENLRFAGTYNGSTNLVETVTQYSTQAGLDSGDTLNAPADNNNGLYYIVTTAGTGSGFAPVGSLAAGDWIVSLGQGSNWELLDFASVVAGVSDADVLVNGAALSPSASSIATQEDYNENVWGRVQVATSSAYGIVRGSTEVVVASGTGIMSVGIIDDGTY
jgi:hypothetical protein